jgi:DNA-binding PadR family transcriptional regulator
MSDNLPELSHLQFAILDLVGASTLSGKNLRKGLKEVFGISKSGPGFYQAMARLEEAKFVEGWYEQEVIDGQIIKERNYKITGSGLRALNSTKSFYRSRLTALRPRFA